MEIVVCHLPAGSIIAPEQTGFASLNPQYPGIEADRRIIAMVKNFQKQLESAAMQYDEMLVQKQELFSQKILEWYPNSNVRDVDFLEIVELPTNWKYTIIQGRSGYEELVIWEKGSNKPTIYNPEA